ncbi:cytochrome c oxidase subunit 7C [Xylocopa sonorina]|uniref:cytochrome c oxidase subunit 7C n=1 Tax=Xylocopa sonorina TaxID=1818115 RepID=UPI00403A8FA7
MSGVRTVFQRLSRSFRTTAPKKGGHDDPEGFPGANIPLNIENKYVVVASFVAFFGSGFALPFLILRYRLNQ